MGFPSAFPARTQQMPTGEDPPHYVHNHDSHPQNLARNSAFLSWSQGSSVRPDCWYFEANDGVISQESTITYRRWGKYSAKISKDTTDSGVSRLYHNMETLGINALMDELYYTFSISLKCSTADFVRVFYYDGSSYTYTEYHSGGGGWETLVLSLEHTSGATDFQIGIECAIPSGAAAIAYADCAMFTKGLIAWAWEENALDRGVICQDWDEDGTDKRLAGCLRIIPFEKTGTTTGGAATETAASMVLLYGCRQIIDVSLNLYSFATNPELYQVWANNFSTTGFDIILGRTDGSNIVASQAWTITGHILAIGWDDPREQYSTV